MAPKTSKWRLDPTTGMRHAEPENRAAFRQPRGSALAVSVCTQTLVQQVTSISVFTQTLVQHITSSLVFTQTLVPRFTYISVVTQKLVQIFT
jgi:hypothetical protein